MSELRRRLGGNNEGEMGLSNAFHCFDISREMTEEGDWRSMDVTTVQKE